MPFVNVTLLIYGVVTILIGIEGSMTRDHSPMSLIGGGLAGSLVIFSVYLAKSNPRAGRILALVVSLGVFGMFTKWISHAPGDLRGVESILSLLVAIMLLSAHFVAMRARRISGGNQ